MQSIRNYRPPGTMPGGYVSSNDSDSESERSDLSRPSTPPGRTPSPSPQTTSPQTQVSPTQNAVVPQPLSARQKQLLGDWESSVVERTRIMVLQDEVTEKILSLFIAGGIGLIPFFKPYKNAVSSVAISIAGKLLSGLRGLAGSSAEAVKAKQEFLHNKMLTGDDINKKIASYPEAQQKAMKELIADI